MTCRFSEAGVSDRAAGRHVSWQVTPCFWCVYTSVIQLSMAFYDLAAVWDPQCASGCGGERASCACPTCACAPN
jgi:hypothetical protein